ncbi:unnamed protein product [Clavelina lepadiformis]|uniref:EGF-like domain-containing protein n=1 Tax=Clavelina lepadiformis TaxID=159417 RepID=A0ABP0EW58_CLALP
MIMTRLTSLLHVLCFGFHTASACKPSCDSSPCQWKWGSCSQSSGGGYQTPVVTKKEGSCGSCDLPALRNCNTNCCRRNCQWASWRSWSSCSATCGLGTKTRSRGYAVTASCGGSGCPGSSTSSTSCNNSCCPVDCVWGTWSKFGKCSVNCGGGMQSRQRSIITDTSCGGSSCSGSSTDIRLCNTDCCPADCVWNAWSKFSSCSASCGGGTQKRSRSVQISAKCGGSTCVGLSTENRTCNTQCCPVDCEWGPWGNFSTCLVTCDGGTKMRSRNITKHANCGGINCSGSTMELQECNAQCCPIDCVWNIWEEWSECSKTCGQGLRKRQRTVKTASICGGVDCVDNSAQEETCNDICCPINCKWSEWSVWSSCDRECGNGTRTKSRTIDRLRACGGDACDGPTEERESCKGYCCPINCEVSTWTPWSNCSAECGPNGTSTRARYILVSPSCGGVSCPDELTQEIPCNRFCFDGKVTSSGCLCGPGWYGECCEKDIDECENGMYICHSHAVCANIPGSYVCLCEHGYTGNGTHCSNIDECTLGTHNCDVETTKCADTKGSFDCECLGGYKKSRVVCHDVNECYTSLTDCHANATCLNSVGSFDCICNPGFTGDGKICKDVDECLTSLDECKGNSVCRNTVGGYWCDCGEPYEYRNGECVERLERLPMQV